MMGATLRVECMVDRVKDGGLSFRDSVAALTPQLRAFARFLARDSARADDLVQDAILRGLERESQWEPGTDLRAWLFRILRNAFLDQQRRRGTEKRTLDAMAPVDSERPRQAGVAELDELNRAIGGLPAAQREALLLVAALEFEVSEAASIVGVPEGTIKARVFRARAALARRFGPRR